MQRRIPRQLVAWHDHVARVRAELPMGTPYRDALRIASESYTGSGRRAPAKRPVRRPVARRGGSFISDLAHGVGTAAELLGLGARRRRVTRRRPVRGGAEYIAGETGGAPRRRRVVRRRVGGEEEIGGTTRRRRVTRRKRV